MSRADEIEECPDVDGDRPPRLTSKIIGHDAGFAEIELIYVLLYLYTAGRRAGHRPHRGRSAASGGRCAACGGARLAHRTR